ncbi:MAG: hypothetical protein IKA10_03275 [Oscillospiraceae bacterium]|nr:hypothetical protein [Oscillospiraceae bacterium]
MKGKLDTLCKIVVFAATIACIVVNFDAAYASQPVSSANIAATGFYLIFIALMTRFGPASKTITLLSLYSLCASIIGVCGIMGGWTNMAVKIIIAPVVMVFYGIKFFENLTVLYIIISGISMVILVYSLTTLANRKPKQPKQKKTEVKPEEPAKPEIAETAESAEAEIIETVPTTDIAVVEAEIVENVQQAVDTDSVTVIDAIPQNIEQ